MLSSPVRNTAAKEAQPTRANRDPTITPSSTTGRGSGLELVLLRFLEDLVEGRPPRTETTDLIGVASMNESDAFFSDNMGKTYLRSKFVFERLQGFKEHLLMKEKSGSMKPEMFVYKLEGCRVVEVLPDASGAGGKLPSYDIHFNHISISERIDGDTLPIFQSEILLENDPIRKLASQRAANIRGTSPQVKKEGQVAQSEGLGIRAMQMRTGKSNLIGSRRANLGSGTGTSSPYPGLISDSSGTDPPLKGLTPALVSPLMATPMPTSPKPDRSPTIVKKQAVPMTPSKIEEEDDGVAKNAVAGDKSDLPAATRRSRRGLRKTEDSFDESMFKTHDELVGGDGRPIERPAGRKSAVEQPSAERREGSNSRNLAKSSQSPRRQSNPRPVSELNDEIRRVKRSVLSIEQYSKRDIEALTSQIVQATTTHNAAVSARLLDFVEKALRETLAIGQLSLENKDAVKSLKAEVENLRSSRGRDGEESMSDKYEKLKTKHTKLKETMKEVYYKQVEMLDTQEQLVCRFHDVETLNEGLLDRFEDMSKEMAFLRDRVRNLQAEARIEQRFRADEDLQRVALGKRRRSRSLKGRSRSKSTRSRSRSNSRTRGGKYGSSRSRSRTTSRSKTPTRKSKLQDQIPSSSDTFSESSSSILYGGRAMGIGRRRNLSRRKQDLSGSDSAGDTSSDLYGASLNGTSVEDSTLQSSSNPSSTEVAITNASGKKLQIIIADDDGKQRSSLTKGGKKGTSKRDLALQMIREKKKELQQRVRQTEEDTESESESSWSDEDLSTTENTTSMSESESSSSFVVRRKRRQSGGRRRVSASKVIPEEEDEDSSTLTDSLADESSAPRVKLSKDKRRSNSRGSANRHKA